jgi:hypothetical protein
MLLRIARLTTDPKNLNTYIRSFFIRLRNRGYKTNMLLPIFNTTIVNLNNSLKQNKKSSSLLSLTNKQDEESSKDMDNTVLLHLRYHPHDPTSQTIQKIFRETLRSPIGERPLEMITNWNGEPCRFNRLTIAYSRHLNLGNIFTVRKFNHPTKPVSVVMNPQTPIPYTTNDKEYINQQSRKNPYEKATRTPIVIPSHNTMTGKNQRSSLSMITPCPTNSVNYQTTTSSLSMISSNTSLKERSPMEVMIHSQTSHNTFTPMTTSPVFPFARNTGENLALPHSQQYVRLPNPYSLKRHKRQP